METAPVDEGSYFDREYFTLYPGKRRYLRATERLLRHLQPPSGPVLDVGSGFGFLIETLRSHRWAAVGAERSLFACGEASKRSSAPLVQASAESDLPFRDEAFGAVLLFDVIEHLENYGLALRECLRVLRPDGIVVVSTNNATSLARPLLGTEWSWHKDPTHRQLFGPRTLTRALTTAAFRAVRVRTYFNFCSVGESTPFLKPLRPIGRLVFVPWIGDALLATGRKA